MDRTTIWLYISARTPCIFSWIVAGLIELVSYICDDDDKALILHQATVLLKWLVIK